MKAKRKMSSKKKRPGKKGLNSDYNITRSNTDDNEEFIDMESSFVNKSNIEDNDTKSQLQESNTTSEQDINSRDTKEGIIKASLSKLKGSSVETNTYIANVNDKIYLMNIETEKPNTNNINTNSCKLTNTASMNTKYCGCGN